jgi:hypothetical protein
MMKRVVRIDPSPMNLTRWCLTLECGHEVWITCKGRPKNKKTSCEKCR